MRRTVRIEKLVKMINRKNKESTCDPLIRQGWNNMLESILHESGVYVGHNYYTSNHLGKNIAPGLAWRNIKTGKEVRIRPNDKDRDRYKNIFPDENRRFYYCHHYLSK